MSSSHSTSLEYAQSLLELRKRERRKTDSAAYDWLGSIAREKQKPPAGDWLNWLILAGRGFGKTRTGAEWVRLKKDTCGRLALVGPTADDVRAVMVEGVSGILATAPPWDRPIYEPSRRRLIWPNGAIATAYSADEPDRLRGPNHDSAWADELASWRYPEAWDMLVFGNRLGANPQMCITTTPRPIPLLKKLIANPKTVVVRGSTYENEKNLAPSVVAELRERYEGTRLGRQELDAEILEDVEGALWNLATIEANRVRLVDQDLSRIVVAVDPSGGSKSTNDEQGIVVAGRDRVGIGYVLADWSCKETPSGWGKRAVQAFDHYEADCLVYEANFGGAMVRHTLQTAARSLYDEGQRSTPDIPLRAVVASRGKTIRAEPISALYEQGKVKHAGGFPILEAQMTGWVPGDPSPDRLDALVWALTDLLSRPSGHKVLL